MAVHPSNGGNVVERARRPVVINGKIGSLPFHDLAWDAFERLVWELVVATENLSPCYRYGTTGQAQGGIDIAGRATDGSWSAFQVKQVAQFTEASARKALDLFVRGPRPHGATRLVMVTSCSGTRTQVRDAAHRYREQYPDLNLGEVWDAEYLGHLLRPQPLIVARYFGDEVALRFCDNHAVAACFSADGTAAMGIALAAADPFGLEIHEAISIDGAVHDGSLPRYFRRPFDDELDAAVEQARNGQSVIKVLLGDSSTGKSRAAYEAIRRLSEEWRLWHPVGQDDLLGSIDRVAPRTVLWLNEINRYLLSNEAGRDEQVADRLSELLRSPDRAPVLVVGTAWHEHWSTMTTAPRNERARTRSLLARHGIRVPENFGERELATLAESGRTDSRMLQAARLAESGHVIQYLAGGPAQLERYEMGSPAARAVLNAAMDARRLGHGRDLPRAFLEAAAAAYLTPLQRDLAPSHWFRQAVDYLSAPCRGVRGPLAPVQGLSLTAEQESSRYRLSDFIELHARRLRRTVCPGGEFWSAGARCAAAPQDKVAMSREALARGRRNEAESLAMAAAEEGEGRALFAFAEWTVAHGNREDAVPYYELAAEVGDAQAQVVVAWRHEQAGRLDEAETWYRRAMESSGRFDAAVGLASVLTERGRPEAAAELYDRVLEGGFFGARVVEYQARWLSECGKHEQALLLAEWSFDAGNQEAFTGLAWTYRYKDPQKAIDVLLHATKAGDENAPRELAWIYEEEGEPDLADRFCEIAVSLGETNALRGLGMIRRSKGDHRSAAALFWRAYNLGLGHVLFELAELREKEGNIKQAERLYRRALGEGQDYAANHLVRILEASGRTGEAEDLAGDSTDRLRELARARAKRGAPDAAEALLTGAIARGEPYLLLTLAELRQRRGDLAGGERALREARDAGVPSAAEQLAKLVEGELS
ncbi:tetratricopeptide repeat protein [Streptomyces sp. NPDC102259]|uniref:tetratricopeptide repeat protein n=1 Tax=Streptomyces sp. NPDC102259 TaxID=3366148 RepID=UPI00381491E3